MKTIKTAISIDSMTFSQVNRLSRKLHISRSSFFTQAARYMVEKDENLDLLKRINACFEADGDDADRVIKEKKYAQRKVLDRW
jgi:metal-responsive CopG/Arc/MetJ family transcriptional regulator